VVKTGGGIHYGGARGDSVVVKRQNRTRIIEGKAVGKRWSNKKIRDLKKPGREQLNVGYPRDCVGDAGF